MKPAERMPSPLAVMSTVSITSARTGTTCFTTGGGGHRDATASRRVGRYEDGRREVNLPLTGVSARDGCVDARGPGRLALYAERDAGDALVACDAHHNVHEDSALYAVAVDGRQERDLGAGDEVDA